MKRRKRTRRVKMADLKSLEAKIDEATTRVQADLQKMRDQLNASQKAASTLSPEDQATIDRLEMKIAALDPTDPTTTTDVPEAGGQTAPADPNAGSSTPPAGQ
jgi:hypothetical protein